MVNKKISIYSIVIIVLTGLFAFGGPYLDNPGEVKPDIIAHFHLSGMMQESPDQDAISALEGPVLTLHRILSRIDRAAKDERVKGVIVSISYIGMGMGTDVDFAQTWDRKGVDWIQVGCDYSYMIQELDRTTQAIRHT